MSIEAVTSYSAAIAALTKSPNNPELQRRVVLALARAGATVFALSEYKRYGLDQPIKNDNPNFLEDIMALGGRLYKDLYLSHSGTAAREYAQKSSRAYEAAFKKTGGYYSGINSAAMALMADAPDKIVHSRAASILENLPEPSNVDAETLYYIEATRAEAYYLLGQTHQSREALSKATQHDPLNYTAHATTLKQFSMIAAKRGHDQIWTSSFRPPRSVHFLGHLFSHADEQSGGLPALQTEQIETLRTQLSDRIQREDIGYGYGALAAGSDILIAESLLAEGCELHITLPVPERRFLEHSVAPYGESWVERYKSCKKQSTTFTAHKNDLIWPNSAVDQFNSLVAMGRTLLQARSMSAETRQFLIWDGTEGNTGTARDAAYWVEAGHEQFVIKYPGNRPRASKSQQPVKMNMKIWLSQSLAPEIDCFDEITDAVEEALARRATAIDIEQILHLGLSQSPSGESLLAKPLAKQSIPGSILLSQAFASVLTLTHGDQYASDYLGENDGEAIFALRVKGRA